MEGGAVGHNIERGPPKDHPSQICFNLVQHFRGEDLKVIFYQNMSNLYNVTKNRNFFNCPLLLYYKSK
jgi:hypothetical protein